MIKEAETECYPDDMDIGGLDTRESYSNLDDILLGPSIAEDIIDAECLILRWLGESEFDEQ